MQESKDHDRAHSAAPLTAAKDIVALDRDHPGFRDLEYRGRRQEIARIAMEYREGDPVPEVDYTPAEVGVWQTVCKELAPLHQEKACRAYHKACELVPLPTDRVPQLAEVNTQIGERTGFQMLPVAGLVEASLFLEFLSRRIFVSTQYMRHSSVPLYTPEPDIIHELIGHASTLGHPTYAKLNQAFGDAAKRASPAAVKGLIVVYWYTLEFGACREDGRVKAYGAGLLSSFGELGAFDQQAELRDFNIDEMFQASYDPTNYQKTIWVAPSFEAIPELLLPWLENLK